MKRRQFLTAFGAGAIIYGLPINRVMAATQNVIGAGQLGVFDPSVDLGYLVYSAVDVSPVYGWGLVSTRVKTPSGSDSLLFSAVDMPLGRSRNYETSSVMINGTDFVVASMVCHQDSTAQGDAWKKYDFTSSWIQIVKSSQPVPIALLAGSLFNATKNNPVKFQNNNALIYAEPSLLSDRNGYWLACQAQVDSKASNSQIRLFHVSTDEKHMSYIGDFFTKKDMDMLRILHRDKFANTAGFGAPNIFRYKNETFLMVTPMDGNFIYSGLAVFRVRDITKARIERRYNIFPELVAWVPPSSGFFGAGAYTDDGILASKFDSTQEKPFTIIQTGVKL